MRMPRMPVAMLMRVNNPSRVLMRMSVYFVVRVVIRIVAHLVRYPPIVLASPSLAFLRVIIEQPLLRTLTPRLGESIDALSRR